MCVRATVGHHVCRQCVFVCVCEKLHSQLVRNNGTSLITSPCTGRQGVCVCVCLKLQGGGKGWWSWRRKEGGGAVQTSSSSLLCSVSHTHSCLASHWLNPQLYIYVIGQGGLYIYKQRGSVKSGHKFQNFQTGQTDTERQ